MEAVLGHYNVRLRRVNQHALRGLCPLPTHSSEKSKESFGVDTRKNIWACQSNSCSAARQGKKGGNVLDFVSIMERSSIRDAAIKLQEWFGAPQPSSKIQEGSTEPETKRVAEKRGESADGEINKPLTFALKDVDPRHAYLQQRGVDEATAKHFGVGFFPGRGMMSGRVVVPIHNERGELIAYAGRAIDASEPKYKLPVGFKKSAVLFNLHRVLANNSRQDVVIIVEGFFDCLKVWQSGSQNVLALMGSTISEEQIKLLHPFQKILLLLDGDQAGREGSAATAKQLLYSHFLKMIALPDGVQPDRLSSEEIQDLLK